MGPAAALVLSMALSVVVVDAQHDEMRPAHTMKLTPENFDNWIKDIEDAKKTAFVRWMAQDNNVGNCTWLGSGFAGLEESHEGHGDDNSNRLTDGEDELGEEGDSPGAADEQDHFTKLTEQLRKDPCSLARAQAEAWNKVTLEYKNDPDVVFGDVIMSDYSDLAARTKELYTFSGSKHDAHEEQDDGLEEVDDGHGEEELGSSEIYEEAEHGDQDTEAKQADEALSSNAEKEESQPDDHSHFEDEFANAVHGQVTGEGGGCHLRYCK